jgi:hypothetical protein
MLHGEHTTDVLLLLLPLLLPLLQPFVGVLVAQLHGLEKPRLLLLLLVVAAVVQQLLLLLLLLACNEYVRVWTPVTIYAQPTAPADRAAANAANTAGWTVRRNTLPCDALNQNRITTTTAAAAAAAATAAVGAAVTTAAAVTTFVTFIPTPVSITAAAAASAAGKRTLPGPLLSPSSTSSTSTTSPSSTSSRSSRCFCCSLHLALRLPHKLLPLLPLPQPPLVPITQHHICRQPFFRVQQNHIPPLPHFHH